MGLSPGDIVDGKLRLDRELGSGTFGSVWAAEHIHMGTRVAVKILKRELARKPEIAQRFLNEARTAAKVTGPHMATIFDCDMTADGRPFIVMELLHGENLGERVARLGPLPLVEVANIFQQICDALTTAHAVQVVHRDIKPANVFLLATHEGLAVKLLDFGIAKHLDHEGLGMTRPDALLGTPAYMSPEQLLDPRCIDHRADLWSAAAVAYECLLARPPFDGKSMAMLQASIARGAMTPPRTLRPELPPALDDWFAQALAPRIDARFQSAAVLAHTFVSLVPEARPLARGAHRDLAISPTAPQPIPQGKQGTEMMVAVDDLSSTIPMAPDGGPHGHDGTPQRVPELGATIKDPSLAASAPPSAPPAAPGPGYGAVGDPSHGAIAPSDAPPAAPAAGYGTHSPSTAPPASPGQPSSAPTTGPVSQGDDFPIESVTASAIPTQKPVALIAIVASLVVVALVAAGWALFLRG